MRKDDLLAFQFAHFGDDSRPEKWFVTPDEAINFEPEYEALLGYYEDGIKRTLTDEDIAFFRRREQWDLERRQAEDLDERVAEWSSEGAGGDENFAKQTMNRALSPRSDVSSLEDELVSAAVREKMHQIPPEKPQAQALQPKPSELRQAAWQQSWNPPREHSQSSRSDTVVATDGNKRRRTREVPYEERHKRNWESYIEANDPLEGSLTHRRLARELDDQKQESIEMDY